MAGPPNSFVGRAEELADLARLRSEAARLVTLLGTAGTGKTRLAKQYASGVSGPVWFCDLTEARELEDIAGALGRTLGIPLVGDPELIDHLGHALAARGDALVVLDNVEQVADHAARALSVWLDLAPEACFLVTSRERLQIAGEVVLQVGPLPVPEPGATDPDVIAGCESVQLLLDRARGLRPTGPLGADDARLVASIVRRLEGNPLAIELCAARMGLLGPAQILAMLTRQLDVLSMGARSATARQATLRAAITWSWDLLRPEEQQALAECSVFRGGFALDAAAAVLSETAAAPSPELHAIALLQALHDKSLMRVEDAPGLSGERRYALYESVRELATEELAKLDDVESTTARHAAYYLRVGAAWQQAVEGPGGMEARRRLALETENLLAVHEAAMAEHRASSDPRARAIAAERAACALVALEPVFTTKGPCDRYERLVGVVLSAIAGAPDAMAGELALVTAQASLARAWALFLLGRQVEAAGDLERAVTAGRDTPPGEGLVAKATTLLALSEVVRGAFDAAAPRFAAAEAALGPEAPLAAVGFFARSFGLFLARQGRIGEAFGYFEQALAVARRAGDAYAEALALSYLASRSFELGRLERARAWCEEALAAFVRVEDLRLRGTCLGLLGAIDQEEGRFDEARVRLDEALAIHRAVADRHSSAGSLGRVGALALEEGNAAAALVHYEEAVAILREVRDPRFCGLFLAGLATAEAACGDVHGARLHFDEGERLLESAGTPTDRRALAITRAHLDLAMARAAARRGEPAEAARHDEAARRGLARAQAETASGEPPPPDEVRCVVRILARTLERHADAAAREGAGRDAPLSIGPEARWFEPPGGARVDMLRRGAIRRILLELASTPGQGLPLARIVEIGWPGERIHPLAAANRAKVAVNTLRKLGLAGILQTRDDGYVLDPAVRIVIQDAD